MQHPYSPNGVIYLFTHWNIQHTTVHMRYRAGSANNTRNGETRKKERQRERNTFFYSVSSPQKIDHWVSIFISSQSWISQVNVCTCMTRVLVADSIRAPHTFAIQFNAGQFLHCRCKGSSTLISYIWCCHFANCSSCSIRSNSSNDVPEHTAATAKSTNFFRYKTIMWARWQRQRRTHTPLTKINSEHVFSVWHVLALRLSKLHAAALQS